MITWIYRGTTMRPHYRPPRDKQYFHTQPKIDKRTMGALKKKIQIIQRKKSMRKYEERIYRG
jgi:hypothetical protein